MNHPPVAFWSLSAPEMLQRLQTTPAGLTSAEATQRLARYGANLLKPHKRSDVLTLLLAQFKSPIILILVFATGLSLFLRDPVDACIILTIVLVSGLLGLWQERSATNAVEKLLAIVQIQAAVLRDGGPKDILVAEIVPGDMVILNAGALVPGDCLVQESTDLFVDEAMLTGETFPVEKAAAVLPAETPLGLRTNALWMGTHVVSGSAKALVIRTGKDTEFGKVSERLKLRPQETAFEHGIRQFGSFLMEVTLVEEFSHQGCRTLGVAYKKMGSESRISKDHEAGMTFVGFLVLFDPPKPHILETIVHLKHLGVALKVITGDNHLVAAHVSQQMGLAQTTILTGPDLHQLSDEALLQRVGDVDVFAEIEPNQKERLILALRKAGNVVGYIGDGINDASALHAADVGISVESAVDVAKEAADNGVPSAHKHDCDAVHSHRRNGEDSFYKKVQL